MIERISPINMDLKPECTINRDGWQIPLVYVGERTRSELFISDLSHVPKWSLQGPDLDGEEPCGLKMPGKPGGATVQQGILLARLTPSEARIMVLDDNVPAFMEAGYTDVTDAYASIAIVGARCFDVLAKLSTADLDGQAAPFALLAPLEELTCFMARLDGEDGTPGIIVAGARGYGHFLLDAFLQAGEEYGMQPAGWQRFKKWRGDK